MEHARDPPCEVLHSFFSVRRAMRILLTVSLFAAACCFAHEYIQPKISSISVEYNVTCSPKWMIVTVSLNSSSAQVYLDKLKAYPGCQPEKLEGTFVFRLPLDNIYACGTTRMLNKLTGVRIYYHRVIAEDSGKAETMLVTCTVPPHSRMRRNLPLPKDFQEPEFVNVTEYLVARGPVPYLNLAVRQRGKLIDTATSVQPGTPLEMLVYLDKDSADTYGLLASFLKVTDNTPNQEEVVIMNGCSIDPYIFGNFESSENGDLLSAKFRAFKFPDSDYVLFVGTVSVCLQRCRGVPCADDILGFGKRRKRAVPTDLPPDPNRLFQVEMTTFLRVQSDVNKGQSTLQESKGHRGQPRWYFIFLLLLLFAL